MPIEFKSTIHRFSIQSGVVPTATELYPGELALNLIDGKLFTASITGEIIDLTAANSRFIFSGSSQGDLLVFDSAVGMYVATRALDVLDGGTY